MANCVIVSALGALLLSRLAFVVATLHEQPKLDWLALKQGGLLGIAAVAGASLGAALYLRKHELSIWKWLDVAAPALALGVVLIRSGCYLHGCDHGLRLSADAPEWLAELGTFPRWGDPDQAPVGGALAWVQQVTSGTISPEQLHAQPVHPTQLYEAVTGLVFLGLCWYGIPRRRFDGQLGLSLLLVYALSRFLLDTLRADVPRGLLGPHLELRVYLPLGLALFAIAFAYGPALSIASARQRNLLMLLSLLPALFALWFSWWHTGPASQLSISQWLALLTAGAAAHAWSARAHAVQL
jgi:prolipoprotein diacylglyceryltransferase